MDKIMRNLEEELKEYNLSPEIGKALIEKGFEKLTEIQRKIIPIIMEGKDVVGKSRTGTGKTASFAIPIIEKIKENVEKNIKEVRNPKSLIIVPTRELALQVREEIKDLSKYITNLRSIAIYGRKPISKQIHFLKKGIDIIVGTPGRIIDHLNRESFKTNEINFIVLDEADEMIAKGFIDDIKKIIEKIKNKNRQMMLFSATFSPNVKDFCNSFLKSPAFIEESRENNDLESKNIEQFYVETSFGEKKDKLLEIISKNNFDLTIIFVNTKGQTEKIQKFLKNEGVFSDFIHGDLSQYRRESVINSFKDKERKKNVLVTTDVSARGLHINGISHVINYDLPQNDEFYVHRIGRTGRAGAKGKSITIICGHREKKILTDICRKNKYSINKW